MKANRERRMIIGRVEARALTDAEKAEGYIGVLTGVIPLNSDSVELRDRRLNGGQPFVERIAPKAFDISDVTGVAGHTDDPLAAFGRTGANLTVVETPTEIRWEAKLPNTQAARDLAELGPKLGADGKVIRAGIIQGTSFEFDLGAEDRWEKRGDGTAVRTVVRGKLSRVNPVLDPAYDESELTVSMRGRNLRDCYYGNDIAWDPKATPDAIYAVCALGHELCELSDALEYLRGSPAGAHAAYAQAAASEAAAEIAALTAWLAANGATVDPAFLDRAQKAAAEARTALPAAATTLSPSTDATRERRRRALSLAPVSPLVA